MKSIYKIITRCVGLAAVVTLASCGEFGDMNVDPKRPLQSDDAYLFTSGTKKMVDWNAATDVNFNLGRVWAQYWSQVQYTSESRYNLADRQVPDAMWADIYKDALRDLREARTLAEEEAAAEEVKANKLAILDVMDVYGYQLLVDMFGNVPYSEALQAETNPSPAYDPAAAIYDDLISRINNAVNSFNPDFGAFGESADIIYGDDVAAWLKFANSLKLRLGIRLVDVRPDQAAELIESSAAEAFTSNEDNAMLQYMSGAVNGHPLYATLVASGRRDYVPSNTLVDYMNELEDPRRDDYMTTMDGEYIGLEYGKVAGANWSDYSQIADELKDPTFPGQLMTYSEVEFILAEAAERGIDVEGTAEEHYSNAVEASILQWGGTEEEAAAYLSDPGVAYATAEGGDPIRAIAMQKWLSLYNDGQQGWIEWKRLDWPLLNPPENMEYEDIPVRYLYPYNEPSLNGENYEEASEAIGGDRLTTHIFWDAG